MYTEEQITEIFNTITEDISNGCSLRKAINSLEKPISISTFFIWIKEDEQKSKQYACACAERAEYLFEETLEIADETTHDKKYTESGEVVNNESIQRSRLRVDTRKWFLSKIQPKKYGDKLDLTTNGESLNKPILTIDPLSDEDED